MEILDIKRNGLTFESMIVEDDDGKVYEFDLENETIETDSTTEHEIISDFLENFDVRNYIGVQIGG